MDGSSVRLILCLSAVSLLPQTSLGSVLDIVNRVDTTDEVQMECLGGTIPRPQPAIFTFVDPLSGVERELTTSSQNQNRLDISVFSHNETIVRCRVIGDDSNTESESIAIAGRPQFTASKPNTLQYVFSNSTDVVNFSCPLSEPGQLFGMPSFAPYYEYMWDLRTSEGFLVIRSNETFKVSDNNRTLQVHFPTPLPLDDYRFECHATVRRCNKSIISCGIIVTTNARLYPSPPGFKVKIVDLDINVTSAPSTRNVPQGERAVFTCVAAGLGNFDIKWEVDGIMIADGKLCDDMEICTAGEPNGDTSTLRFNTERITPDTTLTIVCVVNQTLPDITSLENDTTEVILPSTTSRTKRSEIVQLEISSPLQGTDSNQRVIIVFSIVFFFLLLLIIILAFCVVCIFRYHYKKYDSNFGRRLRRTFSRDPSAMGFRYTHHPPSPPHEMELGVIQGTDTPPMIYTDTGANVVNDNHLGGKDQGQIYNISQISGVSSYSGLSGVSQNNGPHQMPHYKEPSVLYGDAASTFLTSPTGCNQPAYHRSNSSRRPSDTSGSIHSGTSYGHYPPPQHFQQPYVPSAFHGSHTNLVYHQHQHSGEGQESASLPRIRYVGFPTPPHITADAHQQHLVVEPHPSVAGHTYPTRPPNLQTGVFEKRNRLEVLYESSEMSSVSKWSTHATVGSRQENAPFPEKIDACIVQ